MESNQASFSERDKIKHWKDGRKREHSRLFFENSIFLFCFEGKIVTMLPYNNVLECSAQGPPGALTSVN